MFSNCKKEDRVTLQKLLLWAGVILCSIGLLMLIPLSRELAYNDAADSNALVSMTAISALVGTLAIFLSRKIEAV
jgi:cell division protein FtsW (lipid II flippase)